MLTSVCLVSHSQASIHMTPRIKQLSDIHGLHGTPFRGMESCWSQIMRASIPSRQVQHRGEGGDLVEEDSAIGLEGLPLQAGAEDDQRRHRPILVEAQVLCRLKQC